MIMSTSVLVGYATRYGTTQEAAEVLATVLRESGFAVDVQPASKVRSLAEYSAVVLGASLFMFHWHSDALHFLAHHQKVLMERPVAVFALGPVQNPCVEKEWKDSRAQLDQELAKFPWFKPVAIEMFGGEYNPAKLGIPLKWFTGKAPASDMRDLAAVRTWAGTLAAKLEPSSS
jgi:menaquinone-dependent protoporphyrinogen oxidase